MRGGRSELLLVGSLPAGSTESALRAGGELFGDLVFALPDGETGPRRAWVGYEREQLVRPNPDVATVSETESPTGIPRHAYETPVFKIRDGVSELHWDSWPRIDDAIASYRVFRGLRGEGVIPEGLRFQLGLPFPSSALNAFKADSPAITRWPSARLRTCSLVARAAAGGDPGGGPGAAMDLAYEVLDLEGVLAWTPDGAWERFAGPVGRLTRQIPEPVAVGYDLCYGTFPEWPMSRRDMGLLVSMAHVSRLEHRPLRKRAVAEVVADRHRLGDLTGEAADGPGEPFPGAVRGQHALEVEHFVGEIHCSARSSGGIASSSRRSSRANRSSIARSATG